MRKVYEAMKEFCDIRAAARDEYLNAMRPLETAKGSQYYTDRQSEYGKKRSAVTDEARAAARKRLREAFAELREANHRRKLSAPSDEQLRILQALNMRTHVSENELRTAANTLADNAIALATLQDIAKRHGYLRNFALDGKELTIDEADQQLDTLAAQCGKLLESGANPIRLMGARFYEKHHGAQYNEDDLPQVPLFETESQFEKWAGYGEQLKQAVKE